jgi:uncharacterized membrane protein
MILILLAVMAVYLATIFAGKQKWANVASPVTAFVIGAIIWINTRRAEYFRFNWIFIAVMVIFWGLTDTVDDCKQHIWAVS